MAGLSETYVVHGATTICDMGIRESMLVLRESHGVYLKDKAQISVKDALANENIICFGGCRSPENPLTVAAAKEIVENVRNNTGVDFEAQITDIFTCDNGSGKNVMDCVGECTPVIVAVKWDKEKEDVSVADGKNALLGEATLTCKYGGIIKIIDAGQPEE